MEAVYVQEENLIRNWLIENHLSIIFDFIIKICFFIFISLCKINSLKVYLIFHLHSHIKTE